MMTAENRDNPDEPSSGLSSYYPLSIGVWGVIGILLRWSWLIIPLVALSLYLAVNQTSEIDPEYTAEASVLLTGPNEIFVEDLETSEVFVEEVNPLQALGGSLSTVAKITAIAMTDTAVLDQLESEGLSRSIEVKEQSRSPILVVTVVDNDGDLVKATADRVVELIAEDLDRRQDALDAPETDRIRSQPIAGSVVGPPDYGGRSRVRLVIAVVGTALAVSLAFALEALRQLIRRRRRAGVVETSDQAAQSGGGGDRPDVQPSVANGDSGSAVTGRLAPVVGPVSDGSDVDVDGVRAGALVAAGSEVGEEPQADVDDRRPDQAREGRTARYTDPVDSEGLRVVDVSLDEMIQNLDSSTRPVSDATATIEITSEELARYRNGGGANGSGD